MLSPPAPLSVKAGNFYISNIGNSFIEGQSAMGRGVEVHSMAGNGAEMNAFHLGKSTILIMVLPRFIRFFFWFALQAT